MFSDQTAVAYAASSHMIVKCRYIKAQFISAHFIIKAAKLKDQ